MITLNDNRAKVLKHVLNIAGEVLGLTKEDWFSRAVDTSNDEDWFIHNKLNEQWVSSEQTPEDEEKLYTSPEYALDICKCYTHWTKGSVKSTVAGILDIRKQIPGFGDGWTFVDYFAGVGLSSIYLAQQLTAAGIDAKVIYHNSASNKTQVSLAKRFHEEFGSPSNLSMHLNSSQPKADFYLFYEIFEHIREPWSFVEGLLKKYQPKAILHVSRFNLPLISGHFRNYTFDGKILSGKSASKEFEARFKPAGYVRTDIPQLFNGVPRVQIRKDIIPPSVTYSNMTWNMKLQKKLEKNKKTVV